MDGISIAARRTGQVSGLRGLHFPQPRFRFGVVAWESTVSGQDTLAIPIRGIPPVTKGQVIARENDGGSIADRGGSQDKLAARRPVARRIEQSTGLTEAFLQRRCDGIGAVVAVAEETLNEGAHGGERLTLAVGGGFECTADETAEKLDRLGDVPPHGE